MSDIFNNELFEAFASASDNVYIYVCDMRTNLSRWSKAAVTYFGLEDEYLQDADKAWAKHVHPDDLQLYEEDIAGVFGGRKKFHNCQYRARNASGKYVWVECKGCVIRDANGDPLIFAGLMTRIDGQSKYDSLTGLMTMQEVFNIDFTSSSGVAMLIGLDGFRKIMSAYGYNAGDEILVKVASRLSALVTPGWKALRFNGDEFLVLAIGAGEQEAEKFFRELSHDINMMSLADGHKLGLSITAGGVRFPDDAGNREILISKLEHSMEFAKSSHRGELVFFSEEIAKKHERAMVLREDLKQSIKNGYEGFELYFQPFISPETGKVAGCECLLRWKGERIKDSYPMEFIKVLEQYGDIRKVGLWVMEEAIRQQVAWREKYGELMVSFNVSYQQFTEPSFAERTIACAEKYGAHPEHVIIELTESCEVENPQELAETFGKLRNYGFKMALDDFGTAYASMEMLKWLPVDYVKVEHSFIRELAKPGHEIDYVIVDSLLEMCRRLGYESIIEGVEDGSVAEIVGDMHATLLQGYHYSRPVCKADFEKLLDVSLKA